MEVLNVIANGFIILVVSELALSVCVNIVKVFRCRVNEGTGLLFKNFKKW